MLNSVVSKSVCLSDLQIWKKKKSNNNIQMSTKAQVQKNNNNNRETTKWMRYAIIYLRFFLHHFRLVVLSECACVRTTTRIKSNGRVSRSINHNEFDVN